MDRSVKHLNIKIYGEVQGVSFRYFVKHLAEQLGVTGFVRNETDGSVYIETEGEDKSLKEFVSQCKKGPTSSKVGSLEISEGNFKSFKDFQISV